MDNRIIAIHCPHCGAPAEFDIVQQQYVCGYCGGRVEIKAALREKQGFRSMQQEKLKNSVKKYKLFHASCSGCGAQLVFEENEALSNCAFCGRSLVRSEYLNADNMPESVIPFGLTVEEAQERLKEWCLKNQSKPEARKLLPLISELKGFYLSYEMVRGPVHMRVARMDGGKAYQCEGFLNDSVINRSKQLDNLLLDGMEPFDISALTEFDFAFVAGHRVKISDIADAEMEHRARQEAAECYTPAVRKTLETKAIQVNADVSSAVRMPILLPVYYICKGNHMAAVNGQTGKVSVRAEKESHYYFLPWWLKAILATLVFSVAAFVGMRLFGADASSSLFITGVLAAFFLIVLLCLYSDTTKNRFSVEAGRKIYTSGEKTFHREGRELVFNDAILKRKISAPVFFYRIKGEAQPVELKFTSPWRVIRMTVLCIVALFLPVIIALFLNGFDFEMLNLGGSAVWFCIAVPIVPVYLLKFGIVELYEKPWIYPISEKGKRKRYKEWPDRQTRRKALKSVLRALFVPPVSIGVWFGIICFFVICYLTAFGFE